MKIGLVLSGGGVSGAAHIGVLEELEKSNIKPDLICGTSVGAVLGFIYADLGLEGLYKFRNFMESQGYFKKGHSLLRLWRKNIFQSIKQFLGENMSVTDISQTKIKYACTTVDLIKGECILHEDGDPLEVVMAAASIPGIFAPRKIMGGLHVDGGMSTTLPASKIRDKVDFLIASILQPLKKDTQKNLGRKWPLSRLAIFMRSLDIMQQHLTREEAKKCDFCFQMPPNSFRWYRLERFDEIMQIGQSEARKHIPRLLSAIDRFKRNR